MPTAQEQLKKAQTSVDTSLKKTLPSLAVTPLAAAWIETPLGPMLAIAGKRHLHMLEFVNRKGLLAQLERVKLRTLCAIRHSESPPIRQVKAELKNYFAGKVTAFTTPTAPLLGSSFARTTWDALKQIPYGQTIGYKELAAMVNRPRASRAVAMANGSNQIAIIIPCHRVVRSNGNLGGYAGGLARKRWLIDHEKKRPH